ncbi:DUF6576 domain-containing protein [Chryseobacterium pennipullorum]|uniref:Rhomboid family protein n=1 Tax=Chryseobacterium pennipullorum TaxID=2258963 RepID=A0A3D9B4P6_9FLAO|nr:DUF6576 domain-containing protein [Chryseobacterium pennipullorum]REC48298.1 rhomboid family protein [Chryseobacterium pennipullorum]
MSELLILGTIVVIVLLFFNRERIRNRFFPASQKNYYTIDDQFNSDKREREKEIDRLLSKMGKNGVSDLSEKDRKRLDELSKM